VVVRVPRRQFLASAAATSVSLAAGLRPMQAADAVIEIDPSRPGPRINPQLYGHFIEHLGGVIYDGIWVGRDSPIRNIDGIRASFINDMKRIEAPALRWPGGCFAEGYHWRDGIGARNARPRTYNYWEYHMPKGCMRWRATSSASMNSCGCADSWAPSRISPPTSDRVRRASFTTGCRTATRRRAACRSPTSAPATAIAIRSRAILGRRPRIVGLRRQHDGRRIRHRVSQVRA
jgi:hypothetical protein